ncbi:MAG: hypothetical protein WA061_04270 [Microgenomates group bacterium]
MLLIAFVVILASILTAEIYYLFVYKKQQKVDNATKLIENTLTAKKPPVSNLYKKVPEIDVNRVYDNIPDKIEATRTAYKNGVLSELVLTERYKSILTNIGETQTTRELADGTEKKFDFIIQFSNMAEEGKKEMGVLLTKEELKRVTFYKMQNDEEVLTDSSDIKAGDLAFITIETSLLSSPSDSLVSMKIVKLL